MTRGPYSSTDLPASRAWIQHATPPVPITGPRPLMTDRRLGIVLEAPPGDGSFVDHAVRVGERLRAEGVGVDVRVLDDRAPDPAWEAVLAHGAGTGDWARAFAT